MPRAKKKPQDAPPVATSEDRRLRYNNVVQNAKLVALLLSRVDFKVSRENTPDSPEKLSLSFGGGAKEFAFEKEAGAAFVRVEWLVELKAGRKMFGKCLAGYDVIYDGFVGSDEEMVRVFVENIAQTATYSYFRSLYASLDWAADFRSPPLPILKVNPRVAEVPKP